MNWKRLSAFLVINFLILSTSSCIRELGITFPSINKGKKKKKMSPTFDLTQAVFDYKKNMDFGPKVKLTFLPVMLWR